MRFLFVGSGFRATYLPLLTAAVVASAFPEGTISQLGPFPLQPELRVMIVVPILCALATAVSHNLTGSKVIHQVPRVHLLRSASLVLAACMSALVLMLATFLGGMEVGGALLRNYLWLSGLSLATSALFGVLYAWFPLVGVFGLALVFPSDESDWSLYGLLLRQHAAATQTGLAIVLFMVGAGLFAINPRHFGYLPSRGSARRGPLQRKAEHR